MSESKYNLSNAKFGGGFAEGTQTGGSLNDYSTNDYSTNNIADKNSENRDSSKSNAADVKTILVLAANPKTTSPLRLDEEVREIDAGLQRARNRGNSNLESGLQSGLQFDLQVRWAVRVRDVAQALLDFKPQIVHFCGHGAGDDGLVLEEETGKLQLVPTAAIAELFGLFSQKNNHQNQNQKNIECVILNACYSQVQATAISQHIPYVIGMNKAIGDKAAIEFTVGFYSALAAGESIDFAYKLGCNSIAIAGIGENLTPVLKTNLK
ncbi:MAG: CHAT domain-containing protein [Cyanobacteria bacterium P01_A01_bin.84]